MKREQLGSRLGFIMLSAGCAIGCGNVWKFPWMCGQNGGGSFMLIYLLCLVILGIPALGRARTEMGDFRLVLSAWQHCPDGILHCCLRLDHLLFCTVSQR